MTLFFGYTIHDEDTPPLNFRRSELIRPAALTPIPRTLAYMVVLTAATVAARARHVHHGLLGQLELAVRDLAVLTLVLSLVAQKLPA